MHTHATRTCLMRRPLHLHNRWNNRDASSRLPHARNLPSTITIVVPLARAQHPVLTAHLEAHTFVFSALCCGEVR